MKVPKLTICMCALVALAAVSVAHAETFELELKKMGAASSSSPPVERMIRSTYPQYFYMQTGQPGFSSRNQSVEEFKKVVKKEPAKYVCKSPFRGVAELGTKKYGFVFDTNPDAKDNVRGSAGDESKIKELARYSRLYFDANGNGDLTDDTPIDAPPGSVSYSTSRAYARHSYPTVDVTVDAGGTKVDYAFTISVYGYSYPQYSYARASMNAAAYRTGEITVDGEKAKVVLVDFNSNGRFDDLSVVDGSVMTSDGTVYPKQGDMIWVNPVENATAYASPYDPTSSDAQQYVSKTLNVDGKFYDVEITPAGDKLTLSASSKPVGFVTNPNKGYRAVVYGDQGMMKITGDETGKAPLPAGSWKLLSYTLIGTESAEESSDDAPSLLDTLANALTNNPAAGRPRPTLCSARGKRDAPAVEVREGETVEMPFGTPYKLMVTASPRSTGTASLGLKIVGVAGEVCNNMMIKGARPPKPTFTITGPDGKEVASGNFEYG